MRSSTLIMYTAQKGKDKKQYAAVLAVAKGKFGGNLTTSDATSGISVKDVVYTDGCRKQDYKRIQDESD